ncbi:MAG TPA: UDP-3-O-(3-hydroxymyristoyl)glucosamine N-acyltransferase [Candidatus Deferrimicrobium sp.]|nr:UDP-3-O-(3-hydroxymyristoyl)glucosamine N-acyltransferase [Candidatus Deferrimicrobium sp.]
MICLNEISRLVEGELKGDPTLEITSVNSLYKAGQKEITFSIKDDIKTGTLKAGALIVAQESRIVYPNLIYVKEPYLAFARLLAYFFPHRRFNEGIDEHAYVSPGAVIGEGVSLGAFAYVGENCHIGDNTEIHAGVKVYRNVKIGKDCLIYANVVIREDVEIGDHVIIQPGAVVGADGFGFTRLQDGTPVKIPQKGKVIIGSYCEIGANTCIDRSTIDETVLKDYVKMDNLVQIGHNVKIGKGTAISALTGISGSAEIGENVIMGGQVGIADHIKITDGVMIAAKTGVTGSLKERCVVAGYPHMELRPWRRNIAIFKNLESYMQRIKSLETKIKDLEKKKEMEEK